MRFLISGSRHGGIEPNTIVQATIDGAINLDIDYDSVYEAKLYRAHDGWISIDFVNCGSLMAISYQTLDEVFRDWSIIKRHVLIEKTGCII